MINKLIKNIFVEEEQVSIIKKLVRTASESPGDYEEALALKIQEMLKAEGISSQLKYVDDRRPNLYAKLEGNSEGKTLLYNGHLDTVPVGDNWTYNPFSADEDEQGYIYGRGAADMKSGVAAMLYAAICLKKMGYPKTGRLILFFNADEETTNLGMKQFLEEDFTVDYAIISEPTNLNINIGHRGSAKYLLKTYGTARHAAVVDDPDNAIEKMNKLLSPLFEYSKDIRRTKQHDFLGSAKSNVTIINGGTAPNIIPDECTAIIERRLLPGETNEMVLEEYQDLLSNQIDVDFELTNQTFLPASLIDRNHELVQTVFNIAKSHKEGTEITSFKATCEAPFFSVEKNIPTIIYGPGCLSEAHTSDERVPKSQVISAGKSFINICMTLLK